MPILQNYSQQVRLHQRRRAPQPQPSKFNPKWLKKLLETPKGLAPGSSGLRAEHLQAILTDRNLGISGEALDLLAKFVNLSLGGYLPTNLQTYFCGGRLIPLNKKDTGIRPIVVGELLRALIAKASLKEVEHLLVALQPLQLGVGRKGPVIQAPVLTAKSWIRELKE